MAQLLQFSTHNDQQNSPDLGVTIARMDSLSQGGFGTIAETARKALDALQQAEGAHPLRGVLAEALDVILAAADMAANDINCQAEASRAVGR